MADKISYTINDWHKSDVLTAKKLNATEAALARVVAMINGNSGSQSVTLEKSELIASEAYVDGMINSLDYTPPRENGETDEVYNARNTTPGALKTIASLTESNGTINVIYQEIPKASGTDFGVVKAGTNLSASEGTLSVIDSPVLSGSLTLDGAFEHSIKADEQLQAKVPQEIFNAAYKTITLGATPASLQDGGSWTGTININNASTITLQGYKTNINTKQLTINSPLDLDGNFMHSLRTTSSSTDTMIQPTGSFSANYLDITLGSVATRRLTNGSTANILSASSNISLQGKNTSIETSTLEVSSISTFSTSLTVGEKTVGNDTTTLAGTTTLYGTVNIEGGTTLTGTLSVSGSSTLSGGITTGNATMTTATAINATITNATITNINDGFTILHSNNNENISLYASLGNDRFSVNVIKDNNNSNVFSIDVIPVSEDDSTSIRTNLAIQCPINIEVSTENAIDTNGVIMSANNASQTVYALTDDGHISLAQGITCNLIETNTLKFVNTSSTYNYKIINTNEGLTLYTIGNSGVETPIISHYINDLGDDQVRFRDPIRVYERVIFQGSRYNEYQRYYSRIEYFNSQAVTSEFGIEAYMYDLNKTAQILRFMKRESGNPKLYIGSRERNNININEGYIDTIDKISLTTSDTTNGNINLDAPIVNINKGSITIGNTTLTEQNLIDLLTLLS